MIGWRLFQHAVRMVVRNFAFLVRTTLPIWLVMVVGMKFLVGPVDIDLNNPEAMEAAGGMVLMLLAFLLSYLVATTWIAVVWHRYVLLEELPSGPLPPFDAGLIWSYFVAGFVNALVLVPVALICAVALGIFAGIAGAGNALSQGLLTVLFFLPVAWVGLRIGVRLPAMALGEAMTVRRAWGATTAVAGDILVLAVINMIVLTIVPVFVSVVLGNTIVNDVVTMVLDWLSLLLTVSVLTALYGHVIQNRPI